MKNIVYSISGGALLGLASLIAVAPASAAMYVGSSNYQQQDQYIGSFCDRHPDARECSDWQSNHRHWSRWQYQSFYRHHHNDGDFGFTAGAIVTDALNTGVKSHNFRAMDDGHAQACASAYRSYSTRTDTYLGYDGARHECLL